MRTASEHELRQVGEDVEQGKWGEDIWACCDRIDEQQEVRVGQEEMAKSEDVIPAFLRKINLGDQ